MDRQRWPGEHEPSIGRARRDASISLRVSRSQRALIDRAARAVGKNRSDFMLEAACREADAVLLDRCFFLLDDAAYRGLCEALDRSPSTNPRLRRLMMRRPTWDR